MLDGDKLIEMIGHASVNSPLDDFLIKNGIKYRPKGNSGSYDHEDKDFGIRYSYYEDNHYDEKFFIPKKSSGNFILQGLIFRNKPVKAGMKPFAGIYPYALKNDMSPEDLVKLLGKPRKFEDGDEGIADSYVYFFGMLILSIDFEHSSKRLNCASVHVADKYDRKHGLID